MATDTEHPQALPRKPVRVLVAEDSPLNLAVALKQLEKLGYQADAATDGTKVVEALERTAYDIILMDCQMPEMSGYEATWQIREQEKQRTTDPATVAHVYIIAMTANTEADNRDKCKQAGMDDFIVKPVQLPELEAALHRALADRATQQALEEVIDPVVIAGLRQLRIPGKPDPLAEIIDLFLQEAPAQLDLMRQAIAKSDMTAMARIISAATALKGSASNLGASNLAALGDEIEQAAKAGFLADAVPVLDKAAAEFARVRDTLEKMKSEAKAG